MSEFYTGRAVAVRAGAEGAEAVTALAYMTKLFERSSQAAKIGVWECNLDGGQLWWTDVVYDIFDLPRGCALDRQDILSLYAPESRAELERVRSLAIERGDGFSLVVKIVTRLGREKWIRITATVECDERGPHRIFGLKQDVTEERLLVERTQYLADYDSLTGLANRSLFQKELAALLRSEAPRAILILVDLDGFKDINDGHGHAQGDRCLAEIARRLRAACSDAVIVARIGGDEFAVLFDRAFDDAEIAARAARIVAQCREPVLSAGECLQLGASVGVSTLGPQGRSDPSTLVPDADLALYAAKAAGKSGFRLFKRSMRDEAEHRRRTIASMDQALDRGELELFYQPKVRLADGRLHGFEALLRRRGPDGEIEGPAAFQAALDHADLSRRIGRFVVEAAVAQAADWRARGFDPRCLSINAASAQVRDPGFANHLIAQVEQRRLAPGAIEIEITEGVFLGNEGDEAFAVLSELRGRGFRIALDDFGTGFASLVHLRNYPIDVIKIDRSFVSNMLDSPPDLAILECMLDLGVRLGKDVVVEGVENAAQAVQLRILGSRIAQGVHFAMARPAREVERYLRPHWRWPAV